MSMQAAPTPQFRDIGWPRWTLRQVEYLRAVDSLLGSEPLTHGAIARELGISAEAVRKMLAREPLVRLFVVDRYRQQPGLQPNGRWRRRVSQRMRKRAS